MTRSRRLAVIDGTMAVVVLVAWLYMLFFGHGTLSTRGLSSLKFFTTDSNLLMGVSALVCARYEWRGVLDEQPLWVRRLRFVATVAVTITFLVVLLVFAPPAGFVPMYLRANFAFHLVVPLVAIATFCAYQLARPLRLATTPWGLVPPVAYGACYMGSVLVVGPEADFYGFLGLVGGSIPAIVGAMLAATCLISVGVWFAGGGRPGTTGARARS